MPHARIGCFPIPSMGAQIPLLGHPRLAPKGGTSARALLGEQEFSLLRATVEKHLFCDFAEYVRQQDAVATFLPPHGRNNDDQWTSCAVGPGGRPPCPLDYSSFLTFASTLEKVPRFSGSLSHAVAEARGAKPTRMSTRNCT